MMSISRRAGEPTAPPENGGTPSAFAPYRTNGTGTAADDRQQLAALRAQMSNVCSMFALAMVMFDRTEELEILRLAVSSLGALGSYRAEGTYLVRPSGLTTVDGDDALVGELTALGGADGPVTVEGSVWSWAFSLRAVGGHTGYLVVSSAAEPSIDQRFLLTTLAQLTGSALVSAGLHERERTAAAELSSLNGRLGAANGQLADAVSDLEQRQRIHEVLTRVAAAGAGVGGIADAVHELTGMAVALEDRFGNLVAWAGPGRPCAHRRPHPRAWAELLMAIRRAGRATRHRNRILAVAQPRDEVIGVLSIVDADHRAGELELYALEHGAVVLAMELAHQRALAEAELRLRRDLVDDLIDGTDDESAWARAAAVGHDLHQPHQVLVARWEAGPRDEDLATAFSRAATRVLGSAGLTGHRGGCVVLLVPQPEQLGDRLPWKELHRVVTSFLRTPRGSIGVGRPCDTPADLPQSYGEAQRALQVRLASNSTGGVTRFDELGIYRLLAAGTGDGEVQAFIREWLGALVDYDAANRSDLVATLWQYYESGGNYDSTARALMIHRSTLRYRLRRIRDLTGHDLGAVEIKLNLHVATRAWRILGGSSTGRERRGAHTTDPAG
jgi:sugar diacid utilization regulator